MSFIKFIVSIIVLLFTGENGPSILYIVADAVGAIAGMVGRVSRDCFKLGGAIMLTSGAFPYFYPWA